MIQNLSTMVEQFGLNLYKFFIVSNLLDLKLIFLKLEEIARQYSGQPLQEQIMNFHEAVGCYFTGTVQCAVNFEENLEL